MGKMRKEKKRSDPAHVKNLITNAETELKKLQATDG